MTGASGGIGFHLSRQLAAAGRDLVLVARRGELLETQAAELREDFGVRAQALSLDLTDPAAPDRLHAGVAELGWPVGALVNNAGFGTCRPFVEEELADVLGMIQLNVTALTHLTRLFLPQMRRRGQGRILNVASTAAFQPGPGMAVYFASKAYVLSFSEALAEELADSGVTVTTLCPGPTRTGFQGRAGMEDAALGGGPWMMDASRVARAGLQAMERGRRRVIPGALNRAGAALARIVPDRWVAPLVARMTRH